jgi:hypothetical protein
MKRKAVIPKFLQTWAKSRDTFLRKVFEDVRKGLDETVEKVKNR